MSDQRVRMKDIAEAAGVSTVAVSKALAGYSGVSESMRARIVALAKEMGYEPVAERRKRKRTSFNIGVLVPEGYLVSKEKFYSLLLQHLTEEAGRCSSNVTTEIIGPQMEKECSVPMVVREDNMDGLVLLGSFGKEYLEMLFAKSRVPLVFLGFMPERGNADCVISDGFYAACLTEDGAPVNPLKVNDFLGGVLIAQAAWIDAVCERNNNDPTAIMNDAAEDVIWSGPYTKYFDDDQKVVLIRDDNYWGQDASMWGKLPVPKYIAHTIYADNAATEVAFKAGEIDVDQQFLPNIQNTWLEEDLPISTYMEEAPYGVCLTMPTAWYNMNNPVLAENTALRKAIAIAVDYDTIIANAMTNQSPSFADVPRSLMNPTEGEQALYDHDAVADLQWAGNDIDGANALLEEAGLVDSDGDGWREYNGEKISLNAVCPNGWTDWMAAMEVVAAAGKNIGIEITTLFPEWDTVQTVFTNPNQTEYDIFMWSPDGAGPSMPWGRIRQFLDGDLAGIENNWTGNWGQYKNDRATEIVKQIPLTSDPEELKALYTEAIQIYLTEVPSFSLMYRPAVFHAVNESVWTNYPEDGDGRNIPPADCTDGYGIAALYELELVG